MKLFLDSIIFSLQRAGGISVYWNEILKRAALEWPIVATGWPNDNLFSDGRQLERETFLSPPLARYLPYRRRIGERSIFHSSYFRFSPERDVCNVTTVHDLTYEKFSKGPKKWVHVAQKAAALRNSSVIICVSENTRSDLIKFYPSVLDKEIKVIYNGVSDEFYELRSEGSYLDSFSSIRSEYIIYVGGRQWYKDFQSFIDILSARPELLGVVVGGGGFSDLETISMRSVKDRILHKIAPSNCELNKLYNGALALIYPSQYEGFGIPVVEAMRAGCPVIARNTSSIPEVAGDAAILLDNCSTPEFLAALNAVSQAENRAKFRHLGFHQGRKFSWDECYELTSGVYRDLF